MMRKAMEQHQKVSNWSWIVELFTFQPVKAVTLWLEIPERPTVAVISARVKKSPLSRPGTSNEFCIAPGNEIFY